MENLKYAVNFKNLLWWIFILIKFHVNLVICMLDRAGVGDMECMYVFNQKLIEWM